MRAIGLRYEPDVMSQGSPSLFSDFRKLSSGGGGSNQDDVRSVSEVSSYLVVQVVTPVTN